MICLTRLSNSIDELHRHSNGRRGVKLRLLLETDNGEWRVESVKNDCVSLGALCRDLWTESHHNKQAKRRSLFYSASTRHDMVAMFSLLVKYVAAVGLSKLLLKNKEVI